MIKRLCCENHPILINGSLAYICQHYVPRRVLYPDGFFWIKQGKIVKFDSLIADGEQSTDAFGWLRNYKL